MKENIIDIINQAHIEAKEKLDLLNSFLNAVDKKRSLEEINKVLMYLNSNLIDHFWKEEILIGLLKQVIGIVKEENQMILNILAEHRIIIEHIGKLNQIVEGFRFYNRKMEKEFANEGYKLIKILSLHAEMEDKLFFPFARKFFIPGYIEQVEQKFEKHIV